jgi:hypothetical protein
MEIRRGNGEVRNKMEMEHKKHAVKKWGTEHKIT